MMLAILVVLVVTSSMSQQATACLPEWMAIQGLCYRDFLIEFNYEDAEAHCRNEGGRLASVSSPEVLEIFRFHEQIGGAESYWVGLRYNSDISAMTWSNGETADQPWVAISSMIRVYSLEENAPLCYALRKEEEDEPSEVVPMRCSTENAFICEASYEDQLNKTCNLGYLSSTSSRCIFRTEIPTTKEQATGACRYAETDFVDINEIVIEDIPALFQHQVLINNVSAHFWTDLHWNGTHLVLPSGTVWTLSDTEGTSWVPGSGECVTVTFTNSTADDGVQADLHQQNCSAYAFAVCGSRLAPPISTTEVTSTTTEDALLSCPHGYNWKHDKVSGFCFWETSYETNRLSFEESRRFCQSYGGDLASLHSVSEEKIGLNFQYGSLSHSYWIGLKLDLDSGEYVWTDGSPVDYVNWAPGEPNHRDMRLRCAAMDAAAKHWRSSLCGILSWFVCKAPKQRSPRAPVLPTRTPLTPCLRFSTDSWSSFEGHCYKHSSEAVSWHRAQQSCQSNGSSLVSLHNEREIGFLLRLLDENRGRKGNRVWIGLNSLGVRGAFRWADRSVLDFSYWSENEPSNLRNQEKCCNMYTGTGLWNDENCNAVMGFICKAAIDGSSTQTISIKHNASVGHCKKGWFEFQDRCYLPVGDNENQRANWSTATSVCHEYGGYMASVRDQTEQAFLSLLMQRLKTDTWIGLHDTIESGLYYWSDNSDMTYTNWAHGEPSFYGYEEDCVMMVFDGIDRGSWKDELCSRKLPFICQNEKDPDIVPSSNRGLSCLHPQGWLQLDQSCYSLVLSGEALSWAEAGIECESQGARLISVTEPVVHSVAQYLARGSGNFSFWIGLQTSSDNRISWVNGLPVSMTRWSANEPGDLSAADTCFSSSLDGFWGTTSCEEKRSVICQVTSGGRSVTTRRSGKCPSGLDLWTNLEGSYCYIFDTDRKAMWHPANFQCQTYGGSLTSIHSMEEMKKIKGQLKPEISSFYIGLTINEKGGFAWTDDSPVDFVYWDLGEPRFLNSTTDRCVAVNTETLRWQVTQCLHRAHFVCSGPKDTIIQEDIPETAHHIKESGKSMSVAVVVGTLTILTLVAIAAAVAMFFYNRPLLRFRFRLLKRQQSSMSFENALYNVDTASMEFENEKNHSFVT